MLPMNAFALSELLIAMGCTGLGALVFKTCEDRRLGRIWLLLNLAIAIYGAGCFFFGTARDIHTALWLWRLAWGFGVVWIPSLHLHFVRRLCGRENLNPVRVQYVIAGLFFLTW
jgi:hypothetical protein